MVCLSCLMKISIANFFLVLNFSPLCIFSSSVSVVHADNDASTTARLQVEFDNISKKDDQNHVKKGISTSLHNISKRYILLLINNFGKKTTKNKPLKIQTCGLKKSFVCTNLDFYVTAKTFFG